MAPPVFATLTASILTAVALLIAMGSISTASMSSPTLHGYTSGQQSTDTHTNPRHTPQRCTILPLDTPSTLGDKYSTLHCDTQPTPAPSPPAAGATPAVGASY